MAGMAREFGHESMVKYVVNHKIAARWFGCFVNIEDEMFWEN